MIYTTNLFLTLISKISIAGGVAIGVITGFLAFKNNTQEKWLKNAAVVVLLSLLIIFAYNNFK